MSSLNAVKMETETVCADTHFISWLIGNVSRTSYLKINISVMSYKLKVLQRLYFLGKPKTFNLNLKKRWVVKSY